MTRFLNRKIAKRTRHAFLKTLPRREMEAAEISGKSLSKLAFKSYEQFWYPDHDICEGPYRDGDGAVRQFDLIMADQVWEHLDFPWRATRNVHAMLRPGGWFIVCVPFFLRYHGAPHDCTRWSARGLRYLLVDCGFDEDLVQTGQWGNMEAARADLRRHGWAQHDGTVSLEDDPDFPIMAWAYARRS